MFGILTPAAFIHGPIETGGQVVIVLGVVSVLALLTFTHRWKWLWTEWLTSLDAKRIGIMYLVLAGLMLVRGGIDALMMRGQQAVATSSLSGYLSPDHFAQIFTAHGVIMIFFVAMTFMFGLINCIVPLQIGTRDVAFPLLNSISFWLTATGAMLVNLSLVVGSFAATGWLAYPPLSEIAYSPGVGVDYYIWALQISGIGTLLAAVNFIVTILKHRAPGMTLMRMPVFVWTVLAAMTLIIFAFPILTGTLGMLSLDRVLGMHFFTTDLGGNAMMYVNLIWAWGHPEVYILMLPGFGIFSEIVPVFAQKRLFGYVSMVLATMAITILSFGVWVHHFFTMGAGADVNAFFGIATMAIAIPTGVKIFNWLFTMFRGRIVYPTPMLWFMGFLFSFILGGMTGVLMSVPGVDFQLHNSLFLVAHFHNMVIGGVLFSYFCGFAYWFPKIFGFGLNEKIGKWAFWLWITGFAIAFIPLYILGLMGMTRRLDFFDASFHPLLVVAAVGACIIALAVATQALQLLVSFVQRKKRRDRTGDYWNGRTLEWSVASPAPAYSFAHIPQVHARDAFWQMKESGTPAAHAAYEDIALPKNSMIGLIIAALAFLFGFGMVWHMWWAVPVALIGIFATVVVRSFARETEFVISAVEVEASESHHTRL
ncbi:MAG TPA: cbb3-type cytochrome c oxidase subunit I [Candidatus Paceibacterota bacterium]|nr:cbb3-type cytochrome c oxidase subunit I [Candidatus Paceibacterota bacterium]